MRNPFKRQAPEVRNVNDGVWTGEGYVRTSSITQEKALTLAPVYSAVRILAQDISTLPLKSYRKIDGERVPMGTLPQLFQTLIDAGQLTPWLFQAVTSLGLRGNAYGMVTSRDGFGYPTAIVWMNPTDMSCQDDATMPPDWRWRGAPVPAENIVHIPWFCLPGRRLGLSPCSAFATTMNLGLRAQEFADGSFDSVPPGTFKNDMQTVNQDAANAIKARVGAAIRTRETIVYGKDWTYTPISISPKDAQMVEAGNWSANLIAGIYGVRPEKIGGTATSSLTYATVEQNQLEYTTSTLRFWAEMLEGHFFGLLPQRQYVKFNLDALVRSDLKSRFEVYQIQRNIGYANIDEIRKREDEPPLPNGEGEDYTPIMPGAAIPAADPTQQQDGTVTPLRDWKIPS
jgi:HK97 family phage portal protein